MIANEIWKNIPMFDNKYQASTHGNIKSLDYEGRGNGEKVLNQIKRKDGYMQVGLYKDGKEKKYLVHRLIAQTFLDNTTGYREVNHVDGNKANNTVDNLEWCSHGHNMKHAYDNGLHKKLCGKENYISKRVRQFDMKGNFIKEYESITQARKETGTSCHIWECCIGKRKSAGNFIWGYVEGET